MKGFSAGSVFFSTNNFDQKGFWKTIFELRIKGKGFYKCIYKCARLTFSFLLCVNFAELYFALLSWHITILFPVLYVNMSVVDSKGARVVRTPYFLQSLCRTRNCVI